MNYRKLLVPIVVIFLALPSTGFAKKGYLKKAPEKPNLSIVFGYLDMDKAPTKLKWVSMKRVRPRAPKPYYGFYVRKGLFFRAHVPTGSYKFDSFGGSSMMKNANYTFNFPKQGRGRMDPIIKKQGVYFVGAYKYKKIKTGIFKPKKFDIKKMNGPSEKELLVELLQYTKHKEWKRLINKRLKALK